MRVFIDTNILISCIVWPNSRTAQAFFKAAYDDGNTAVICEYSIEELYSVFSRKFSDRMSDMVNFLEKHMYVLEIVPVPYTPYEAENMIRDEKDRPLIRAAIREGVDIFITGDKDFLESGITTPQIMSASEFLELT